VSARRVRGGSAGPQCLCFSVDDKEDAVGVSTADRGGAGSRVAHAAGSVVLQARSLSKIYEMGEVQVHALRSVDLDLYGGELMVLLGASGSGKSTLLNIIGGLDRPTSGMLRYGDWDLSEADDQELTRYRRQSVGFVFQLYNLIPSLTALENVSLVSEIAPDPMRPEDALALVGLGDRLDHFPAQLSGGEQQRVAIARAVCKRPELLLCDEPTGALDAKTGKLVLRVLDEVNRETGTTTGIITHNVAIAGLGDRVIHMSSGEITEIERHETRASLDEVEW
jgi:putative ABC transport system ATP-binding protein